MSILHFGQPELTRAEIGVCETERIAIGIDRAQIIGALRIEQVKFANRARADDLRDFAVDNLAARLRLARLIADRDAPARLNQLCDVSLRGMIWHAAHRHTVALG